MSGLVDQTGARSGLIGTTVGTPSGGTLIGVSAAGSGGGGDGTYVTLENNKSYMIYTWSYNGSLSHSEVWRAVVDGSGSVTPSEIHGMAGQINITAYQTTIRVDHNATTWSYGRALVFEEGETMDYA